MPGAPSSSLRSVLPEERTAVFLVSGFALLVRFAVGLHGYSGQGTPPLYGDYEAQRHWMEITLHTPIQEWYKNTTKNDLTYWGLDYPPLTAYQSFLHGCFLNWLDPQAVALGASRGFESVYSKTLMRWTVISADLAIFFPAALVFVATYYKKQTSGRRAWALGVILLQPALILIDHGHFQVVSTVALVARHEVLGSILFCLSLNHKQSRRPLLSVAKLGGTVIATFAAIWWPFLSLEASLQVLQRLVPLSRGLYEDHVANFWCATSVLIKWKQLFDVPSLAKIAMGATIAAAMPSVVQQICHPSSKGLMFAMLNSSLAFFLFAFQVHEKSVLLPLLPATLLALEEPNLVLWFVPTATFSVYPLLLRDGLALAYFALVLFFILAFGSPQLSSDAFARQSWSWGGKLSGLLGSVGPFLARRGPLCSFTGALVLHLVAVTVTPPERYPYLHQALMVTYAFLHFVVMAAYTNWRQWYHATPIAPDKKEI
eukprot:jgi/Mesen1/11014/ME000098S10405